MVVYQGFVSVTIVVLLLFQSMAFMDAKSWFRSFSSGGKTSLPTTNSLKANKWFPLLEYPGKITFRYPKVKLPSATDLTQEDIEADIDGYGNEWSAFAALSEGSLEQQANDHVSKYKHKTTVAEYIVKVPSSVFDAMSMNSSASAAVSDSGSNANDGSIVATNVSSTFLMTLIKKSFAKFRFHSQKYLKLLFVPTHNAFLKNNSPVSAKADRKHRGRVLNSVLISLPEWPIRWKHFAFSTKILHDDTDVGDQSVVLEITTVNVHGSPTIQTKMKKGMKMHVTVSPDRTDEGGNIVFSTTMSYSKMSKAECELIANSILKELQSLVQSETNLIAVRQRYLQKFHMEMDNQREEEKKLQLDRIIHPEKYKSKSGTVRRNSGGNDRYRPSAAAQARRQVKSR
jgi:hypothetical protein